MTLLQMSVTGGMLILAAALFRAVSRKRLPKRTYTVLWRIALLRLLVPFEIPATFSAATLLKRLTRKTEIPAPVVPSAVMPGAASGGMIRFDPGFLPSDHPVSETVTGAAGTMTQISGGSRFALSPWTVVWIAGAAAVLIFFVVAYVRALRVFRQSLPMESDYARDWLACQSPQRKIGVRFSDRIASPLTYGTLRPVILLPADTDLTDTQRLEFVLAHELTHIRHFDSLTKLLLALTVSLHWFNPAVWLLFFLFNRDMELACDEAVVRMFGEDSRREYALALIELAGKERKLVLPGNGFGAGAIKERIGIIMKIRKITWAAVIAAVIAVCGITAVFATTAAEEKPETTDKSEQLTADEEAGKGSDLLKDVCFPLPADVEYSVSAEYGVRSLYGMVDYHRGIDLACPQDTEVHAFSGGTAVISDYHSTYGNYVVIDHGSGLFTLYAHLSDRSVSEGDPVTTGQQIGHVGMTGSAYCCLLHFEVLEEGAPVDPRDYLEFILPAAEEEADLQAEKYRRLQEKAEAKEAERLASLAQEAEREEMRSREEESEIRWEELQGEKYGRLREKIAEKERLEEEQYAREMQMIKEEAQLEAEMSQRLQEQVMERLEAEQQGK